MAGLDTLSCSLAMGLLRKPTDTTRLSGIHHGSSLDAVLPAYILAGIVRDHRLEGEGWEAEAFRVKLPAMRKLYVPDAVIFFKGLVPTGLHCKEAEIRLAGSAG